MAESEEELKSLLRRVKEESEKAGLKLNIQKMKIMASNPITSWQTDGETMETVTDFIILGSKITVSGDCSHEIKRRLLLGRKAMTNLESESESEVPQSCPTLCDPMDYSLPGSSVHGIFQARVLEWVAISFSKPREHIKKQRHHFADKGPYNQSYVFFLVVMYRCEHWTIMKAECQRIDAFKLWC